MPIDLTKYGDGEGGNWCADGWYLFTVMNHSIKEIKAAKASEVVEYILRDSVSGKQSKASFFITEEAMRFLNMFAAKCGLSEECRKLFTYSDCHGCQVIAEVVRDRSGKYHQIDTASFRRVEEGIPSTTPRVVAQPAVSSAPREFAQPPDGEDNIPF